MIMKTKQNSKRSVVLPLLGLTLAGWISPTFLSAEGTEKTGQYRQLPMEVYRDKVEGGWLGQAIAVLWAQWTEGKWQTSMVPFDLEDWYKVNPVPKELFTKAVPNSDDPNWWLPNTDGWWIRREMLAEWWYNDKKNWVKWTPDKMSDQDDLYIEFMFLYSIMKNGLDVTATEMAEDWLEYLDQKRTWGANNTAFSNFRKGIWPPASGHPHHNSNCDNLDFQIEADLFGLICPGMPRISNDWCDKVGHIMNYGDGVYGGMAMAAMYSEAFFESNPRKLAEYSLSVIPAESGYAKMARDVLDAHQKYPDWQDAWKVIFQKWAMKDGKPVGPGDVRANGAFAYMGLLYGAGDFWKSMNISMRCGKDSDCNPSSVAGIIGTVLGMKAIPAKWAILRNLPVENKSIKEIYPALINWDDILKSTVEVGKWNILQNGGYLEDDVLFIPYSAPVPASLKQSNWLGLP
jgi:ADP-ribosylglycohydrolase